MTRYSRKRISVDLLRKLFPDEPFFRMSASHFDELFAVSNNVATDDNNNNNEENVPPLLPPGILQVMRPLRKTLMSSPERNIREVDLSEFSAFQESHFDELFKVGDIC